MEQQPSFEPSVTSAETGSSLMGRLINVFVSPTEVFDEVKVSRHRISNWLLPLLLSMGVACISSFIIFSQPGVMQSMREAQEKEFQKIVQAGQMKQADADRFLDMSQKWMGPISAVSGFFMTAVMFFIFAAIVFCYGRFVFKSGMSFVQSMEINGLASMITVLGAILTTLLTVIYGKFGVTPGFVLLIGQFDPKNKLHIILSVLNLTSLWYVLVLGLGLARLSGGSWIKAALLIFVVWALLNLGPALVFAR